jgi:hypothetical protein
LNDIGFTQNTISVFEDNEPCIALANNPQSTVRTRHIQVKYHWFREKVNDREIELVKIPTKDQLADLLTKGMFGPALLAQCERLNLLSKESLNQREN